jgi:hypothetical protein
MMSCRDVMRLAAEGPDRKRSFWTRMQMRIHVFFCGTCRICRMQMELLGLLFRLRFDETPPPDASIPPLSPEALDRMKQAVRERRG